MIEINLFLDAFQNFSKNSFENLAANTGIHRKLPVKQNLELYRMTHKNIQ